MILETLEDYKKTLISLKAKLATLTDALAISRTKSIIAYYEQQVELCDDLLNTMAQPY